jgi:hypothetical protein
MAGGRMNLFILGRVQNNPVQRRMALKKDLSGLSDCQGCFNILGNFSCVYEFGWRRPGSEKTKRFYFTLTTLTSLTNGYRKPVYDGQG